VQKENLHVGNVTFSKPECTGKARKPSLMWLDSGEGHFRKLAVRVWKTKALDRNLWRKPGAAQGCSTSIEESCSCAQLIKNYAMKAYGGVDI
jgi:hypothetical protein